MHPISYLSSKNLLKTKIRYTIVIYRSTKLKKGKKDVTLLTYS